MQGKFSKERSFSDFSHDWWDINGKMSMLHKMNPVRLGYIQSIIEKYLQNDDIKIADIGCGGGILCEGLKKMGHDVTGFDLSNELVDVAKNHASISNLDILYESSDKYHNYKDRFDVIVCLEVLEHVDDIDGFISDVLKMGKKDSIFIFSTINRTPSSLLITKIMAEYILRKVPVGVHSWRKFLKPSEVVSVMDKFDIKPIDIDGIKINPLNMEFSMSKDLSTNYFISFKKC